MKKNKIMKKVLAMAGAVAVVLSLGGAKVAEAACTHPVSSWKVCRGGTGSSHWTTTHGVTVIDEDTGLEEEYVCTVWWQMVELVTYCGKCNAWIGNDWVASQTHSLPFCLSR